MFRFFVTYQQVTKKWNIRRSGQAAARLKTTTYLRETINQIFPIYGIKLHRYKRESWPLRLVIMMKGIICRGDRTDHGGTVIQGFMNTESNGRAWAGVGHMVVCPRCKGTFPIIEGHAQITVDGIAVAMHGMRTACGAVLLASSSVAVAEHPLPGSAGTAYMTKSSAFAVAPTSDLHTDMFVLRDLSTGAPLANTDYAILRASGEFEYGRTNAHGHTHMLSTVAQAEGIDVYAEGMR